MSENEKVPLYIFWEDGRWVNYKDGVKTIFREVHRQPITAPPKQPEPPTQPKPEINIVYDTPKLHIVNSYNIFDNKDRYHG